MNSIVIAVSLVLSSALASAEEFVARWPERVERVWAGPQFWSNRLQDWRVAGGRLECVTSGANRNVHLLTHQLGQQRGTLAMSVRLGRLTPGKMGGGWAGFRIGIIGPWKDYRDSVRRNTGINAGVTTTGHLFIGSPQARGNQVPLDDLRLDLRLEPEANAYKLTLAALSADGSRRLAQTERKGIATEKLVGNLALVCHADLGGRRRRGAPAGGNVRFWFRDWRVAGSKVQTHPDQTFGPILWTQYTLSRGILKMTAQMAPIGEQDAQVARLEVRQDGRWREIARAKIDKLARTATFRVTDWPAERDVPYRVAYALIEADGKPRDHYWTGTVRHDPVEKETLVVAAFTGNADPSFPHNELVAHVSAHDPDVLFFSGDQIYESNGGYGAQRAPLEKACLDYLRKWYLFGWAFRGLMRDRPTITIPDDHDVYQGNLWGHGGRKAPRGVNSGGYTMPPEWVNMVQRTQTSNLPDPFDPRPVGQGIAVYYAAMTYGGVSFAVLEDRKFKTGPEGLVPPTKSGRSDHVVDPNFDPKTADVPGARLLGERQLRFLRQWATDWRGAEFKVALSQTTFANVATLHGGGLRRLVADYDSNGWPQTGRNKALRELRRCFALHICGDQHLATIVHHGVETWNDAIWAFCVPSICNFYPRAWVPLKPAHNWKKGMLEHTGEFRDPFGNYITVWAHTNPRPMGHEPGWLHNKMPGYGIVRFNKRTRQITMECWPVFADPRDPRTGGQYPGWPKTIHQLENYARTPAAWLPNLDIRGVSNPVVIVREGASGEPVYAIRIRGNSFRPWVFEEGVYTIEVGDQDSGRMRTLEGVRTVGKDSTVSLQVTIP